MKQIWLWWTKKDVQTEWRQLEDEGRDISSIKDRLEALTRDEVEENDEFQGRVRGLFAAAKSLPVLPNHSYVEPSELEAIHAERPDGPRRLELTGSDEELRDRIHGAWLGRCAGCLLGKPLEGRASDSLWPLLRDGGHEMLTDYIWRMDIPLDVFKKHDAAGLYEDWKDTARMPEDDDTNYTVVGMAVVKKNGIDFTPEHVADLWMTEMPILHTCTAERAAYRNFVNEIPPPRSAVTANPYREWIGAQIRADFFGYVALGRPELAAELAWRDACISHVKNGIYGEMWVAAMLACAAVESDMEEVIRLALTEVPAASRFSKGINDVLAWQKEGLNYDEAVARLHDIWDEKNQHHWCHTISNAQVVAIALLYGEKDFEKTITRAVYPCFDTDCNGATAGSVIGMMLGASALPGKWTGLMNDTLYTGVAGYNETTISGTAGEMFELYLKHRS